MGDQENHQNKYYGYSELPHNEQTDPQANSFQPNPYQSPGYHETAFDGTTTQFTASHATTPQASSHQQYGTASHIATPQYSYPQYAGASYTATPGSSYSQYAGASYMTTPQSSYPQYGGASHMTTLQSTGYHEDDVSPNATASQSSGYYPTASQSSGHFGNPVQSCGYHGNTAQPNTYSAPTSQPPVSRPTPNPPKETSQLQEYLKGRYLPLGSQQTFKKTKDGTEYEIVQLRGPDGITSQSDYIAEAFALNEDRRQIGTLYKQSCAICYRMTKPKFRDLVWPPGPPIVCADCEGSKTPIWRKGDRTLCPACRRFELTTSKTAQTCDSCRTYHTAHQSYSKATGKRVGPRPR
ncbi:hypothetical protein F5Y16DRAFT_403406 [Xylariaceae sp. FL0255]|nr:hypothetical protein F5Y16DRAFT_403406 [Xylariaceae sp. FL0255]